MAQILDLNEPATPRVHFKNEAGSPADPAAVFVTWTDPEGAVTTKTYVALGSDPEIVRDSMGEYHVTVVGNRPGVWAGRWKGQGTIDDEKEFFFVVRIPRAVFP